MSYAAHLVKSAEGVYSAYLQYITGKGREGFVSYAFVEDEDDILFYQHALSNIPDICYFGCGGKNNVLKIFEKLASEKKSDGNLFFVDRDTEDAPFKHDLQILRTNGYSWENHLIQRSVVRFFVQKKLIPNPSPSEANEIAINWEKTVTQFSTLLAKQFGLMRISNMTHSSSGASEVVLCMGSTMNGGVLNPAETVEEKLAEIENCLVAKGHDPSEIANGVNRSTSEGLISAGRGKSLFQIFRSFLSHHLKILGCTCMVDRNAIAVLGTIAWNDPALDYVRDYAEGRLGT